MNAIKRESSRIWLWVGASVLGIAMAMPAPAAGTAGTETEELIDLSLEELLRVEVTTVSRRPQTLSSSPAAVFVITQNDIQKSGARTIPDILRMVPGIQVAQLDASTWAVTARGSNGIFANKLLVMQDGRSLYSPMYSGVRWDAQDTDLSSIDRIEVIRGPGAVMWGSNAVNGVINIITKNSADTQGFKANVTVGNYTNVETTVRWGGSVSDNVNYRIFGKYLDRDGYAGDTNGNGSAYDDWDFGRLGGRVDWNVSDVDTLWATGEIYDGTVGENVLANSLSPPYTQQRDIKTDPSGGFMTMNWNRTLSDTSGFSVQVYYDKTDRQGLDPEETRETTSVDFQHHFALGTRNNVVWGFEARRSADRTIGTETISLTPADRTQRLYTGFVQDEIRIFGDAVFLTLGTKVESNNYSQSDYLWSPNARLTWLAGDTTTFWGSVARAYRTPNRIEQNVRILSVTAPMTPQNPFPIPFALTINGAPTFDSEEVVAYELGFRAQPMADVTLDIALFYNDYKGLRGTENMGVICQPAGLPISDPACFAGPFDYVELPLSMVNQGKQNSQGVEVALSYIPTEWWRVSAAYSYLKIDADNFDDLPNSFGEDSPEHQLSLRSSMNVTSAGNLDLWLRYVDDLKIQNVSSYLALDARIAWRPTNAMEVALTGRNLLDSSHLEFREEFGINVQVEVPREAMAEVIWQF